MKCSMYNEVVSTRIIKGMCHKCYQRNKAYAKKKVYDLPEYGEVKYAPDGTVICHICGRSFKKLMNHVYQIHGLNEREYKNEFGLINRQGLIADSTREKLQASVEKNYEKVVIPNLLNKGESTRFRVGSTKKTRRVSEQERRLLIQRGIDSKFKNLKPFHVRGD